MSSRDYRSMLESPRAGVVSSYVDFDRMIRLGQYTEALAALEKNPWFTRDIPSGRVPSIYRALYESLGEQAAATFLSGIRKSTGLEVVVHLNETPSNGTENGTNPAQGNDVY